MLSGLEVCRVFWRLPTAGSARSSCASDWVDVILTDINMPAMDGEEFVRRLAGGRIAANPIPV